MKSRVAIVKCNNYAKEHVYGSVKRAVNLLGGMEKFAKKGERILLKPNLLTAKPPEAAATTNPAVVRAMIRLVREVGATPLVGDSPGIGSVHKIAEKCGVMAACRELDCEFVDLKTVVFVENPTGRTFKRLEIAKEALQVDGIINLPKLKTHAQMLLTLGVKNLFGCVPGKLKPQWHLSAGIHNTHFAGMILDLYLFLGPRLTVLDGIVGMEGNGPGSGDPRPLGLVFAAQDCVSMDRVVAQVLGAPSEDVPILKAAGLYGLRSAKLSNIAVLGEDIENVLVRDFNLPPLVAINFAERLPYFLEKRLRKALTTRPYISTKTCTMCGVCVTVCPTDIMEKKEQIHIDYSRCIRCYCCQEMCPHMAITTRQGWLKRIMPGL